MSNPMRLGFYVGSALAPALLIWGGWGINSSFAQTPQPSPPAATPSEAEPGTLDLRTGGEAPAEPGTAPATGQSEPEVLVAEVVVNGTEEQTLIDQVYQAIQTKAGNVTTRSKLQADIDAVFATGLFADVKAVPSDTALGVRVTFEVKPNPVIQAVTTEGATVLEATILQEIFAAQQGQVLNFGELQLGVQELEQWYADQGYVLAKVVDVQSSEDGTVTLKIAEGEIEDIRVSGNNRTRDFIVTRELTSQAGDVFNRDQVQEDIQTVFGLNLFQDVNIALEPGQDPSKVVVVLNVEEKRTGTLGATAGVSSATGAFGGVNLSEQNLGGNNQSASLNVQVGTNETLFDLNFTDPRIATMDIPTSYNVNIANRQSSSFVFNEGFSLPNGDPVRINRLGGGVTFSRPVGDNWRASLGTEMQFVDARDSDANQQRFDALGNPITFSESGQDSYTSLRLGAIRDSRDNANTPSQGSLFRVSSDQSVKVFENGLNSNRLMASYSQFIPINLIQTREDTPEVLAFDLKAGTHLGDLAPYDAFSLGGGNSVRGFFEGGIGSGRSYAQATAELRFPIFNPIGGVLFADYGTDLGSAAAVIGNPAGVRGKPGDGLGLGAGVRIQSPLGPLRIDYGVGQGSSGQGQLHFGIGEKF
ncbi:MAG: BamA/TamA family outer membrane protein [Cyanobacteriota bacterium]|nr:BamA/TamA family outer membrane protein [Cyanobacteriota bacterium]